MKFKPATINEKKFQELMLYIASRSADDQKFGATKLNKILFYADFQAYLSLGKSITGAEYQRLGNGPAPRELKSLEADLIEKKFAILQEEPVYTLLKV